MKNINNLTNKIVLFLLLIISAYLLYYSFFRSIHLSFTHDESYCYHRYMHMVVHKIMLNYSPSANNHILNTLFMKLFGAVFNEHEVFLRLHSNISHIIYIVFSILLVWEFKNPALKLAGFALLNLNPYMLDFFSLARGYGLVFMFVLTSIYFYFKYIKQENRKHLTISFILAGFAVYSNFATLYYFSSLLFVTTLFILFKERNQISKLKSALYFVFVKNKSIWITALVVAIFIYVPISKLSKANELYGHGSSGFWRNTIAGVLFASFYDVHYKNIDLNMLLSIEKILSVIFGITAISIIIKEGWKSTKNSFLIICLIFFSAAGFEILHHLLTGAEFISMRAAIYIQILFAVMLIFWLKALVELFGKPGLFTTEIVSLFLAIVLLIHFNNGKNLERTNEWKYDADTKKMLSDLANTIENKDKTYKLGINWLFEPSIKYYLESRDYGFIESVTREGVFNKNYDYYYVFKDGFSDEVTGGIVPINTYPIPNSLLTKRIYNSVLSNENFSLLFEGQKVDSLVAVGAKKHTHVGLVDAESKIAIDTIYELPENRYYLGIYQGRVLSFENASVIGRSEPDKFCEFEFEPINDSSNTFYVHNLVKEYLVLKHDTLTIGKDTTRRLMIQLEQ